MEGVIDAPMRVFLSERGSWSYLVTEFVRVGPNVPPEKVFLRYVPELKNGGRTPSGIPVQVQILGGDPEKMAQAAAIACGLGALGIDLNFGCPAATVNRHDGGATLLKYPSRIRAIVAAVRAAVPAHLPVSAKLRLGWEDPADIHENADAAAEGGADWITIHGRTRLQGYAPPAYWEPIGEVRRRLGIPVIANGEIWTIDDFRKCRDVTGCDHFMLGRGALADPLLQPRVSRELGLAAADPRLLNPDEPDLCDWLPLMKRFAEVCREINPEDRSNYALCRLKQWLKIVRHRNPACGWFDGMKRTRTLDDAFAALQAAHSIP
jgi:tRNA-dihydrouridine synthase C